MNIIALDRPTYVDGLMVRWHTNFEAGGKPTMIKCLKVAMSCSILLAAAGIAAYAADPTPGKLKPRRRLRGIRASHIPRRRRLDPKPEAVLGSRRSSISRGVPARRSKAASTRRRASVRKPTKAGRAGLGARGRLAPVAASYEAALYEAGADKGQYDETPHRRPRNAALRDQRSGSLRAPRREGEARREPRAL